MSNTSMSSLPNRCSLQILNSFRIVAVHGLGANPDFTWTYKPNSKSDKRNGRSPVHLLKDLLMNDERFSDARILHFAYNSDWLVDACFESARDIGSRLIDSLVEHRKSHPRLPLIFVGHSFGGIVIKEALSSSPEDSHRILEDTCGVIFLGTPHLGSPVAGFGATIAYFTGFLGSDTGLLLSLRSNGEMLVNLSKAFQACTRKKHQDLDKETKITSICERNPTYLFNWLYAGKIVPWESATFGANFADVYEVDKDHSGLNKCLSPEDPLYKELTTQLLRIRPNRTDPPKINRIQQAVIDRLVPCIVRAAEFHPGLDGHDIGQLECLPKTREELLHDIDNWFDGCALTRKHLYWLQGKAGTGKSTIARTVVSRMTRKNHIVANFFFKRGEGDRARLRRFFTTLASQLARKLPSFARNVQDALESDPSLPDQDPRVQFKKLIQEPLQKEKFNARKAIIIVLDALDECDAEGDISTLVQLLLQPICPRNDAQSSSGGPLVRYFLTSRLDHQTKSDFNKVTEEKGKKKGLEEATSDTTEQDIERYLQFQLEKIDGLLDPSSRDIPWSNPADVKKRKELAKLAGPLFEFAAAACRYIANKKIPGGPRNHLRDILESKVRGDLNGVYLPILKRRFEDLEDESLDRAKEQFEQVIGSILALADSFTVPCFVKLLGVPEPDVLDELQHFESVLIVPPDQDHHSYIKLFHESFRDFLVGPKAHKDFKIDTRTIHERLATRCRQLLCRALDENICGLERPGARRSEVSEETLGNILPQEIQYACRFWIYHVTKSESIVQDDDDWHSFLLSHFLHWLEALSFLGRISEIHSIST
ncbi:vegetative incompatibility het-e-1 [Trichoderma arundinaceum]|uniref:Vegetative incompatibility het-e-1 n=1 Tax=Trichoderma arundinaceum TaxID=490622 RepID=A0A395NPY9_TRIAR|nr:vegetative incompatibility het-e-1 [Trichoderma arundinaceum]